MWSLENAVGLAVWASEGTKIVPLWSAEESARMAGEVNYPGYRPVELSLSDLCEWLLPNLVEKDHWVGVNLDTQMAGIDFPANVVLTKLRGLGAN